MCIRTREFKLKKGIHWQYVNEVSSFMGEEISSFSTRSSNMEASNTPATFHTQSLHASEGHDSQISLTETNKKTLIFRANFIKPAKRVISKKPYF